MVSLLRRFQQPLMIVVTFLIDHCIRMALQ